ncbi:hypothetical protein [Curtobacterium sp. ISL-83]|uniref:hypothetical protein n=1 Tax=Curtobacterium sp. ISL-83 TaxID=2819145 RepID=UPI001BE59A12|nr:hypothetical protein [Curtobacterium sp. ISL-83]MBT2502415.1 hypothetical protein [Curtobacterium sp. ISL-83]
MAVDVSVADLSARLWDERAALAELAGVVDRPDDATVVLDRLQRLRLERDVLVAGVLEQWGAGVDGVGLDALDAAAAFPGALPVPWDLLLPEHVVALRGAAAAVDAAGPPGAVRDRWHRFARSAGYGVG